MIKLTKAELNLYNNNVACNEACEKLVEKVVRHFEIASVERRIMWMKFIEKYKLDEKKPWVVNHFTGEIYCGAEEVNRDLNMDYISEKIDKIIKKGK